MVDLDAGLVKIEKLKTGIPPVLKSDLESLVVRNVMEGVCTLLLMMLAPRSMKKRSLLLEPYRD